MKCSKKSRQRAKRPLPASCLDHIDTASALPISTMYPDTMISNPSTLRVLQKPDHRGFMSIPKALRHHQSPGQPWGQPHQAS